MDCPNCGYDCLTESARYCPECGQPVEIAMRVDIRQDVEHNLGRVIGVQTAAIQGDVYGGDIYQVQVYALSAAERAAGWGRLVEKETLPYKYLYPYAASDCAIFRGREAEIEQVIRQVGSQR